MKTVCFYHNADLDGIASAVIVKMALPDCQLIGVNYGDPCNIPPDTEQIIIVDFSFDMNTMYHMQKSCKLIWIDHHFTAISDFEPIKHRMKNIEPVLITERAACESTWTHFFKGIKIPVAIHLLGIYDTWRINEKPSVFNHIDDPWINITLPFQFAIRSYCINPDSFPTRALNDDSVISFIREGESILRYVNQQNKILAANAFERIIKGYKAIILNQGKVNSMAFDHCFNPELHDLMVAYSYNGYYYRVSLYTSKESVDVSLIAKQFGGGGHKAAAGCRVNQIEMLWEQPIGIKSLKSN